MKLTPSNLAELVDLASTAAIEAGEMIAVSRPSEVERKDVQGSLASQVVTEIDRRAEAIIVSALAPSLERFDLGLLTEEREDDQSRLEKDYFWCIDPLDGTLAFTKDEPGYSVSIALVRADGTPTIGVVYDPVEKALYHGAAGGGAFGNGEPWPTVDDDSLNLRDAALTVFADNSFTDHVDHDRIVARLGQIADDLGYGGLAVEIFGGAVINACNVLANPPACYFKFPSPGGASLWDYAATALLFREAGAVATDMFTNAFELNRVESTHMNHRGVVFATNEEIAERLRGLNRAEAEDFET